MDKFVPSIDFEISIKSLVKINKYLFLFSVFGLLLSAVTMNSAYLSTVIYNISLALGVVSIGFKVLFLDNDK